MATDLESAPLSTVLALAPSNQLNCSAAAYPMQGGCRAIPDDDPDGVAVAAAIHQSKRPAVALAEPEPKLEPN